MALRPFVLLCLAAASLCTFVDVASAQDGLHDINRGPSGYLAWWKLLAITVVFLIWVKMTDWMNKDAVEIGESTKMSPELWNPLSLFAFLIGFWAALSIPIFFAGFPLYLIAAFTPFLSYFLLRRAAVKKNPSLAKEKKSKRGEPVVQALPQDEGIAIKFTAAGSGAEQQTNLIRARQSSSYQQMKQLLFDGAKSRADVMMLDYSRAGVASQMQVDGVWHKLPPMAREVGDPLLASLKNLAGLKAEDRRSKQKGKIGAVIDGQKMTLDFVSQGIQTGERAQVKFIPKRKTELTLAQLGMWPDMLSRFEVMLNQPGLVIVSAPPRGGLTTSWQATIGQSDRITRDWVGIMDKTDNETEMENIVAHRFNAEEGHTPSTLLRQILLAQPDALAVPEIMDAETMDALTHEAVTQERTILTRVTARSASEALLKMYKLAGDKEQFLQALTCVTGQRLVRRLCDTCKTPTVVQPKMIQQLGGNPKKQNSIHRPFKMPPPEQRVDKNGKPIEIPPCETCAALSYIGRIALFELITANDQLRSGLRKKLSLDLIKKLATKTGNASMLASGYQLVLLGITSLAEVQRAMKE